MERQERWKNRPRDSNWGEFGADDQVGRLNLITQEARLRAFSEVQCGRVFCLSLPLDLPGGTTLNPNRKPPFRTCDEREPGWPSVNYPWSRTNTAFTDCICDESVQLYTQYSTQWDALAHVGHLFDSDGDGEEEIVYYNGYQAERDILGVNQQDGPAARALGIENMAQTCVQGRGVMIDLHRHFGDDPVEVGFQQLQHVLNCDGIAVETGDVVCFHTGFAREVLKYEGGIDPNIGNRFASLDGRDPQLREWIINCGCAAIVADNPAVERVPSGLKSETRGAAMPMHDLCLFRQGIHLGELWFLSELNDWLAKAGRNRFLLTAPPLRLPGSFGSPVTPVATV